MAISIAVEDPDQPGIRAMLEAGDAYYASLYPAESNHVLDVSSLKRPGVSFYVARAEGRLLGFGAIVDRGDGWAEIKRMYVVPDARGRRIGRRLLEALEAHAGRLGAERVRLETGVRQPEALGLYRSAGYREVPTFGNYRPDPLSVFMEKLLPGSPSA